MHRVSRQPGGDDVGQRLQLHHVGFQNGVEDFIRRQRVLVSLVGAQLRGRRFGDGIAGDGLALAVHPLRDPVHHRLGHVGDDREPAAHIPVERAIADGDFAFVASGQEQGAELVRHRHENHATQPGLDVLFGDVFRAAREDRLHLLLHSGKRRLDGHHVVLDTEVLRQPAGVVEAARRGKLRGQRKAVNVFPPQRLDGDDRGERRINPAAQAQHDRLETAFVDVVAQAQGERAEDHLLRWRFRRADGRGGVEVHQEQVFRKAPRLRNQQCNIHEPALSENPALHSPDIPALQR